MDAFQKGGYDNYMMGPDAYLLAQELVGHVNLEDHSKILDLGCGKALSSLCLARSYEDAHVYAVDKFVSPRKNYNRILIQGMKERITPLAGDAAELPFAFFYFDSIFCIDAFQIFGNSVSFLDESIAPFLRIDGKLALMMPGFTEDFISMPEELQPFPIQDLDLFSRSQWENLFSQSKYMDLTESFLMTSHEAAWEAWLGSGQPGTEQDRKLYEQGGEHISSLGFILTKTNKCLFD